jgi:site-specific recombinase XerD
MTPTPFDTWSASWRRSLRARNRSPRTIQTYLESLEQFADYARTVENIVDPLDIRRRHVEAWLEHLEDAGRSAATRSSRFVAVRQFYRWLADEEDLSATPVDKMSRPTIPEHAVPIITADELRALMRATAGRTFRDRRDAAVIALLADTGIRAGELVGLHVDDVDLDLDVVHVIGKGRRPRSAPYGRKTAALVDRYLRARSRHHYAHLPELWIGERGALRGHAPNRILWHRCEAAGIRPINPHAFRHTFAHEWLAAGGAEGDLMMIAGWRDRRMLDRYGRSAAAERARDAYRRGPSPVDGL